MELRELYQTHEKTGSPAGNLNEIDWRHGLISLSIYMLIGGLSWIADQLKITDLGQGGTIALMVLSFVLDMLRRRAQDNSKIIYRPKF